MAANRTDRAAWIYESAARIGDQARRDAVLAWLTTKDFVIPKEHVSSVIHALKVWLAQSERNWSPKGEVAQVWSQFSTDAEAQALVALFAKIGFAQLEASTTSPERIMEWISEWGQLVSAGAIASDGPFRDAVAKALLHLPLAELRSFCQYANLYANESFRMLPDAMVRRLAEFSPEEVFRSEVRRHWDPKQLVVSQENSAALIKDFAGLMLRSLVLVHLRGNATQHLVWELFVESSFATNPATEILRRVASAKLGWPENKIRELYVVSPYQVLEWIARHCPEVDLASLEQETQESLRWLSERPRPHPLGVEMPFVLEPFPQRDAEPATIPASFEFTWTGDDPGPRYWSRLDGSINGNASNENIFRSDFDERYPTNSAKPDHTDHFFVVGRTSVEGRLGTVIIRQLQGEKWYQLSRSGFPTPAQFRDELRASSPDPNWTYFFISDKHEPEPIFAMLQRRTTQGKWQILGAMTDVK